VNQERILLVEDDESHRITLERHLSRQGFEVLAVDSALAALARVSAFQPDLVVTDVQMPEMTGFELLQRLRKDVPDVDVIVITGFAGVQGAIDAMREGAYEYLVKPLDLDQLDEVVGRCVAERRLSVEDSGAAVAPPVTDGGMVGRHPLMMELYKTVGTLASSRAAVLIRGETGTGKELIARAIHQNSAYRDEPFVPVNCAAVPESLLESELFGHERGAFTGAVSDRLGRFELAGEGTLFLDEIGDTSLAFQTKLLRVLQEREFYRVGGEQLRRTRARVIAATHQPLEELVRKGRFREDLYFRLEVIEVHVPPLRERRSDVPLLVGHLINRASQELGKPAPVVPPAVMADLVSRDWPGNVRELDNVLTRAVALCRGAALTLRDIGADESAEGVVAGALDAEGAGRVAGPGEDPSLDGMERRYVQRVLMKTGGNKSAAARILDISRPRLDRMIDRHHLAT
jgi:two-component system, NtrC family, response regulator AtoC